MTTKVVDDALRGRVARLKQRVEKALADDGSTMAEFTCTLLHGAVVAHLHHFQTRSYAAHMALGDLYEGLPGFVDSLVEAYQGKYGLVTGYPSSYTVPQDDPLHFVASLREYVRTNRMTIPQDSELQNIIDEIASLLDSTVYKLTFLS